MFGTWSQVDEERSHTVQARGSTVDVGVDVSTVLAHVVVEESVDVGEVVVVGEDLLGVGVREEAVSSRAAALPKNLIALLPYRTRRSGVPEAYCPGSRCTPQDGMGKTLQQRSALECMAGGVVSCV